MNKYTLKDILLGVLKTSVLLIFLELISSVIFPSLGLQNFKPAFNVLIVLFLAFKLETPGLAFLILTFQYIHSIFSIEGWAAGTLTGILISLSVKYVREMLNFSTAISTIVVVQIFQLAWYFLITFIISLKMGDFSSFLTIFLGYLPESFFLSIISHHFFLLMDRFWYVDKKQSMGAFL